MKTIHRKPSQSVAGLAPFIASLTRPILPMARIASLLLCILATVHADSLGGFTPVKVSPGPLLTFIHPEDESGRSHSGGGPRTEVMYLSDPATGAKAVPVWRGQVPLMRPLHRLTQNLTLIERDSQCHIWDMEKGTATPIWPGESETEFLKVEGGKIFFLRRLLPETSSGMKLGDGKDGKTVAEGWFRARDKLCTLVPGDPTGAVELAPPVLEHILETSPAGIWAITADEPRKLCLISNGGTVTDIAPFDKDWVARETYAAFSPTRDFVALSILTKSQDFHTEREMVVVDVKAKTIAHVSHNVAIDTFRSYPPPVRMHWVAPTELLFGHVPLGKEEGEQVLDLSGGKLTQPTDVQRKAATRPALPDRTRKGLFDCEFGKIWFAGDKEPAGSVLDKEGVSVTDMALSPDNQWAAFCHPDTSEFFLLDGTTRQKHRLIQGWSYGIKWLPAAAAGE